MPCIIDNPDDHPLLCGASLNEIRKINESLSSLHYWKDNPRFYNQVMSYVAPEERLCYLCSHLEISDIESVHDALDLYKYHLLCDIARAKRHLLRIDKERKTEEKFQGLRQVVDF